MNGVLESGHYISAADWLILLTPADIREFMPVWLQLSDDERNHDLFARSLDDLSPHLTVDELAIARETCRAIKNVTVRAWALGAIAGHDQDEPGDPVKAHRSFMFRLFRKPFAKRYAKDDAATGLFTEALAAARQVPTENARSKALTRLAPRLRLEFAERFCNALLELQNLKFRAEAIAESLRYLPTALRPKMIDCALADAKRVGSPEVLARVLSAKAAVSGDGYAEEFKDALNSLCGLETGSASELLALLARNASAENLDAVEATILAMPTSAASSQAFLAILARAHSRMHARLIEGLLRSWSVAPRSSCLAEIPQLARILATNGHLLSVSNLGQEVFDVAERWP